MSAIVDIDSSGKISIMEIPPEEAAILAQALQHRSETKNCRQNFQKSEKSKSFYKISKGLFTHSK